MGRGHLSGGGEASIRSVNDRAEGSLNGGGGASQAVTEILYGEHNRAATKYPWRKLGVSPFEADSVAFGWFEDHEGWSGTRLWLSKTDKLDSRWERTEAERRKEVSVWGRLITKTGDLELWPCKFHPAFKEKQQPDTADVYVQAAFNETDRNAFAEATSLLAVEAQMGNSGEWMYAPECGAFVYLIDKQVQGAALTGWVNDKEEPNRQAIDPFR